MSLEITTVKINKVKFGKTVGFARITFNDSFCIDGIRIIDGAKGFFIGMPSKKDKKGEYRDICFPVNSEIRKMITDKILEAYKEEETDNPF